MTSFEPGYRREPLPDPESVGEDAWLVDAIRGEIERGGPITFARFMERALYEPGHGYYRRREAAGPGREGDFLTAPEAHPIFGAAVGRLVEQAWVAMGRPSPFTITEPGAGTGALAVGLLGGLRDTGSPLLNAVRYRPLEVEPARLEALRTRLAAAGLDGPLASEEAHEAEADATDGEAARGDAAGGGAPAGPGAIVANEVVDALPVHRVIGRGGTVRELLVDAVPGGGFVSVEAEPTTPDLADRLATEGVRLADGQVTEVCLGIEPWLRDVTAGLAAGIVILIDYAAEPASLHSPARPTGTLRAFARHAVGGDPFRHVGRQDLTATVDLGGVRSAAVAVGLEPVGETTGAELLAMAGDDLAGRWLHRSGATLADALLLRSALARLMDPSGLGGFRVLAFGRGLPPETTLPALARATRRGESAAGR